MTTQVIFATVSKVKTKIRLRLSRFPARLLAKRQFTLPPIQPIDELDCSENAKEGTAKIAGVLSDAFQSGHCELSIH